MARYTNTMGDDTSSASKRSSTPPCPGISAPESLTSEERLNIDSTKSPSTPATDAAAAAPIHTA